MSLTIVRFLRLLSKQHPQSIWLASHQNVIQSKHPPRAGVSLGNTGLSRTRCGTKETSSRTDAHRHSFRGRPRHVADGETDTTGGSIVLPIEEGQSALG